MAQLAASMLALCASQRSTRFLALNPLPRRRHHPRAGGRDGAARQPQRQGLPSRASGHSVGAYVYWLCPHAGVSCVFPMRHGSPSGAHPPIRLRRFVTSRELGAGRRARIVYLVHTSAPCTAAAFFAFRPARRRRCGPHCTLLHAWRVGALWPAPPRRPLPFFLSCFAPPNSTLHPALLLGRSPYDARSQPEHMPSVWATPTPRNPPKPLGTKRSAQQPNPATLPTSDDAPTSCV